MEQHNFQEVMRQWNRMCKAYTTDDDSCCEGCPVVDFREHGCGAIFEMEDGTDWRRYSNAIMSWAAEHPEPVYPRGIDWLADVGLVINTTDRYHYAFNFTAAVDQIPADIAQKLGLEPKEGT